MPRVLGRTVDSETRCVHYSLPLDVVAIKFYCCNEYYPCHQCHAGHDIAPWPRHRLDAGDKIVLCGVCKRELTFAEYARSVCPACAAPFNPKCALHYSMYFELGEARGPALQPQQHQ